MTHAACARHGHKSASNPCVCNLDKASAAKVRVAMWQCAVEGGAGRHQVKTYTIVGVSQILLNSWQKGIAKWLYDL